MGMFDWLTERKKSLSQMNRQELRREELRLEKDRTQYRKRIEKLAREKQTLFEHGSKEKTPELRRMLAQDFELKTAEQIMVARQLNIRSKEMMTVSRLRMMRENAERATDRGKLGLITEKDMLKLQHMIESDAVSTEMYQQRLDDILSIGAEVDQGEAGLSSAGRQVMDIWDKMDTGLIRDSSEAFDEADRRVRESQRAAEEL